MYKVFPVEGGYQIFWCPHWLDGKTMQEKLAENQPYSDKVYSSKQAAQRRKKQLNDALKETDKMIKRDGAIII